MLQKPKAILFDWDNTLADTWPIIHSALSDTFVTMGHKPWSLEKTKASIHRSMRDYFPDIFGDEWEKAGTIYRENYHRIRAEKLEALPEAHTMLEMLLKDKTIYMAVVSNKIGTSLREEIAYLSWEAYFSKAIGAHDAEEDKPSVAPVKLALEGSGITPGKDVWFIGDTLSDMQCAHNAGCIPIFYGDGNPMEEQYNNYRPQAHVKDHIELIELIRKSTS